MKNFKEEFVNKANIVHNNEYDYSKSDYVNNYTKLIINCSVHGEFLQIPNNHLAGKGCPQCGLLKNKTKSNTFDFVNKANPIHNFKYNYIKTDYKKNNIKVIIICPTHGEFEQSPSSHLRGAGCRKCGFEKIANQSKLELLDFINKANPIHNFKYNYSKVIYINYATKVWIICSIHGDFYQTPDKHLSSKTGCPKCNGGVKYDWETYLEKVNLIFNFKYNYSKSIYENSSSILNIECPKHGYFNKPAGLHLRGAGCRKCSLNFITQEEFVLKSNQVHNFKYDYSIAEYKDYSTKANIICPKHGIFSQTPTNHLQGKGCSSCKNSQGENKIESWLNKNSIKYIKQYKFRDCKNIKELPFDFYLEDYKLLIEYDGEQHYINNNRNKLEYVQRNDLIKNNYCDRNNIKLLRIKYTDFNRVEEILQEIINEQ